ncbi:hypothetical protein BMS3Abin01_01116 [bacterium BMS3Abin01]|nr:hypothetical protein BMS3Abin01_01116 [bacterium BMS3Abin01]
MATTASLKKDIKQALAVADYDRVAQLALENRKVFTILISLSFNKDDLGSWRAIEAMGVAAGRVTREQDTTMVRNAIRRIIWSAREESGGMGWSAPELLGEIVRSTPQPYSDLPTILLSFHEEDEEGIFRRGVLWALGRMAEAGVNDVEGSRQLLLASLEDGDPRTRGMAAWAAVRLGYREAASGLKTLRDDQNRFRVYEDGELLEKTVGQSAAAALQVLART